MYMVQQQDLTGNCTIKICKKKTLNKLLPYFTQQKNASIVLKQDLHIEVLQKIQIKIKQNTQCPVLN